MLWHHSYRLPVIPFRVQPWSAISNGRKPKSCLGRVFNSKLGCIAELCGKFKVWHAATSRVENSAPVSSCQQKFVHGTALVSGLGLSSIGTGENGRVEEGSVDKKWLQDRLNSLRCRITLEISRDSIFALTSWNWSTKSVQIVDYQVIDSATMLPTVGENKIQCFFFGKFFGIV